MEVPIAANARKDTAGLSRGLLVTCVPQAMGMWWQLGKDAPSRPNGGLEEVALSLRAFGAAELDQHADVSTATQAGNHASAPSWVLYAATALTMDSLPYCCN
jgi:hypothetical protein